jgi:hypothetical protein
MRWLHGYAWGFNTFITALKFPRRKAGSWVLNPSAQIKQNRKIKWVGVQHGISGLLRYDKNSLKLGKICSVFGRELSMHSNSHLGISLMAMAHLGGAAFTGFT